MNEKSKIYLMVAGTFLPAFIAFFIYKAYRKEIRAENIDIVIFAAASVLGGFLTAKMLKGK